jgi:hypothetical protein
LKNLSFSSNIELSPYIVFVIPPLHTFAELLNVTSNFVLYMFVGDIVCVGVCVGVSVLVGVCVGVSVLVGV